MPLSHYAMCITLSQEIDFRSAPLAPELLSSSKIHFLVNKNRPVQPIIQDAPRGSISVNLNSSVSALMTYGVTNNNLSGEQYPLPIPIAVIPNLLAAPVPSRLSST